MAEDGRRCFIVGGRACLGDGSDRYSGSDRTANLSLTAEIFELDLGTGPLAGQTAHWRQVSYRIPREVGVDALATTARLSACRTQCIAQGSCSMCSTVNSHDLGFLNGEV